MNANSYGMPSVSVIVPTFREAENLPLLIPQVAGALKGKGWVWEIIVVDDNSKDGTVAVLEGLAKTLPVRWLVRTKERGLSSAVLAGMGMARNEYIVVMDADLSHPASAIPGMIEKLVTGEAEFVIGSRYVEGGKTEDWGRLRWLNSAGATLLSRPLVGETRDPMAGFFALPREVAERAESLNPIGYKIALELMVKCGVRRMAEVPITFKNRLHGESKLTMKEQFRYLEHLSRLYDYKYPAGSARVKFLIAAGCGAAACFGTMLAAGRWADGAWFPASIALGLLAMVAVTLVFFARYVRTQRDFIVMKHPWSEFVYISLAEVVTGWFFAVSTHGTSDVMKAAVGVAVLLVVRYTLRKVFLHDLRGIRGEAREGSALRISFTPEAVRGAASA